MQLQAYVTLSKYINNKMALEEYLVNATKNVTGNFTGLWEYRSGDIYLFDTDVTLEDGLISVSNSAANNNGATLVWYRCNIGRWLNLSE